LYRHDEAKLPEMLVRTYQFEVLADQ